MLNPLKYDIKNIFSTVKNPFKIPELTTEIGLTVKICII
jgi:hypothetical protein